MPIKIRISNDLRYWRGKSRLTQKEVAEYIGISRVAYNRIEKGDTMPSIENFLKICELFSEEPEGKEHQYGFYRVYSEL